MALVFDIESNGLLRDLTELHCIVTCNPTTRQVAHYFNKVQYPEIISAHHSGDISDGIRSLKRHSELIGHNIANFDIPAMNKLGHEINPEICYDTFLGCCMLWPSEQKQSIEAWIERLKLGDKGIAKIPITDWSKLTQLILDRCHDDVLANLHIYDHIESNRWSEAVWLENMSLETRVAEIHSKQELHGVRFNVLKAVGYVKQLDVLTDQLERDIVCQAKPEVKQVGVTVTTPRKQDGQLKQVVINWCDAGVSAVTGVSLLSTIQGPFSKIEIIPLNLKSPVQVTKFLLSLGWKPKEWNFRFNKDTGRKERTSPKLTEKSWGSLPAGMGQKIGEFKTLMHRRNWLLSKKHPTEKGALNTVMKDGRVPAKAMTCATPTSRYRHMETVCNIPSANADKETGELIWYPDKQRVLFGTELRALLGVESDHWQIGVDLSGIEARMKCHYAYIYPGGPELANLVLNGDFHSHNAKIWGVDRNTAKSGLYALMYGCGDAKLADTLEKPKGQGSSLRSAFWDNNPALKALIADLELAYSQKGYILGLDGRVLEVRDKRKLLNTLLQQSAAVVFKMWMVKVDDYCESLSRRGGSPLRQMIAYHDEVQMESYSHNKSVAEIRGRMICDFAEEVGRSLNLRVPTQADFKVGKNWAECH